MRVPFPSWKQNTDCNDTSGALGRQKEVRKRQNDREISEAVQLDWEICLAVAEFRIVYLRLGAYGAM